MTFSLSLSAFLRASSSLAAEAESRLLAGETGGAGELEVARTTFSSTDEGGVGARVISATGDGTERLGRRTPGPTELSEVELRETSMLAI